MAKMGFPNVYSGSWVALFAPAKTPDAIVAAVMKDAEVLARLKAIGFDPIVKNEAETAEYFRSGIANRRKMVQAVGVDG